VTAQLDWVYKLILKGKRIPQATDFTKLAERRIARMIEQLQQ
jgi:hypothetical protein